MFQFRVTKSNLEMISKQTESVQLLWVCVLLMCSTSAHAQFPGDDDFEPAAGEANTGDGGDNDYEYLAFLVLLIPVFILCWCCYSRKKENDKKHQLQFPTTTQSASPPAQTRVDRIKQVLQRPFKRDTAGQQPS